MRSFLCYLILFLSTLPVSSEGAQRLCDEFLAPPEFMQMGGEIVHSNEPVCSHPCLMVLPVEDAIDGRTGYQIGVIAGLGALTACYHSENNQYMGQSCCALLCSCQMGWQHKEEVEEEEKFCWPQILCTGPLYAKMAQGRAYGLSCLGLACVKMPEAGCILLCCGHEQ